MNNRPTKSLIKKAAAGKKISKSLTDRNVRNVKSDKKDKKDK